MHILLTILSVIGKVLLILLVIILALFLILLLVPLRYRLQGKKEKGIPPNGSIRVTFLFRLIALQIRIRSKDDISGQLRVAGFRVKTVGKFDDGETVQERPVGKEKSPERKTSGEPEEPEKASAVSSGKEEVSDLSGQRSLEQTASERTPPEQKRDNTSSGQKKPEYSGTSGKQEEKKPAESAGIKQAIREKREKAAAAREIKKQVKDQKEVFAGRAARLMEKVCDAFLFLFDAAYTLEEKADGIEAKITKVEKAISYWDTGRHRNAVRYIIRRLFILLKHYMPRRIEGYLYFGTGRPHLTGYATGLLSLLLPAGAGRYDVAPDFYEAHLETDTCAVGHIRAVHIGIMALAILCRRDCRVLIRSALRWRKRKYK